MDTSSLLVYDSETWSSKNPCDIDKNYELPDGHIIIVAAEAESKDRPGSSRGPTNLLFGNVVH